MKTSSKTVVAAFLALSQLFTTGEAFTSNSYYSKSTARTCFAPLHYKNELLPEIKDEVLVSTNKGKKKCCKGCTGCKFATAPRSTEPTIVAEAKIDTANKRTMETNYRDAANGEGLPLF